MKSLLILIFAALLLPISCAKSVKNQETQQNAAAAPAVSTYAPDMLMPQEAKLPVLKIGTAENTDVYLQSLDIQVEVTGNIASTRYTMVFKNKTQRILEGELTFPLPDERSVTYYALDINGRMREAVPVEKAKATQVFEEIERRQVDPGLLERVEGNNFRTRIYPIPANGTRTVSIGYEEELALENGLLYYRLPMDYPDSLEKFAVNATVWKSSQKPLVPGSEDEIKFDMAGENYVASLARENYKPSRALIFALPAPADIPQVMMQPAQGSHYFLASVAPQMETRKKQWGNELAIIWDVSLSASQRNLQREMEMLDIIFAENKNAKANIYFLNNKLKKIASGNWKDLKSILEMAVFDGGTDFSQINLNDIAGDEILFFSDGISTLSDADFLKNAKASRPVHCIVSSSKADYSAMKLIAGKTKGKFVNINSLSFEKLKNELQNETLQFLGMEHGSAVREAYPSIAMPVHGNFSVAGISDASDAEITLLFGFGNKVEKKIKVKLDAKNASSDVNAYKIWAQKKIAELDLDYEKNRDELVELGQQFGIITRNTSLMVLETISDYVNYNIMPPASEPELQAAYQRMQKGRDEQVRKDQSNMLDSALAAAEKVKKWWNTDFTPKKPKYPVPDIRGGLMGGSAGSSSSASSAQKTNKVKSKRGDIPLMDAATSNARIVCQASSNDEMTIIKKQDSYTLVKASCGQGWANNADIEIVMAGPGNKGMKMEAVDVVGWLDNPSAVFVLEQDAGGFEGINIDRNFNDYLGGAKGAPASASPSSDKKKEEKTSQPTITIKTIKKDNEYLNKLTGKTAEDYKIYLELRNDYASSPTFYFDMAEWFYNHNDKETALRILTSIAELELENASLYRLLGYRLKEYGEYALEKFVCQKVVKWRPMDPQSHRDYALALADNGEDQAALDSLYSMLTKLYPTDNIRRSRGLGEVAVTEMNRLIARNTRLNTSKIDKRLIINIPIDVRVVINWNMNNRDIDLHVFDPNGERCYYRNRETSAGGRLSGDNTGGYGPEQFMLKKAIKGKYKVYVNYFSAREFTQDGPATIMAEVFIKYAGKTEQRKVVSLQVTNKSRNDDGKVEVAEFEF